MVYKRMNIFIYLLASLLTSSLISFAANREARAAVPDPDALRAKARYFYVEGSTALAEDRLAEAYEYFRRATQTDPSYPEAAYAYASMRMNLRNDTLRSRQEVARSIALMRPLVDAYPGETGEAMQYSFIAARSGDLDEAIRVAERTDSLRPDLTSTLLQLSSYYAARKEMDKAVGALDRYETIEGSNPQLTLQKFSLLFAVGDSARLLSESERMVRENPVEPEYIIIRGNVFEAINQPDSAYQCYIRAERLQPDNGRTKLTLANFFLERGDSAGYDLKSQEALLSEDIMLDEKLDMMTRYMQNLLRDSADTSRGSRLFDGLLRQYPHEPQVLDLGAKYSSAIGDYAKAEELMAYATDLQPDNPDYWTRLASFYYSDEKYPDVMDTYSRASQKLSDIPHGLTRVYAAAATQAGASEKARTAYQSLLDEVLPGALLTDSASVMLQKAANLSYDDLMQVADILSMAGDASFKAGNLTEAMEAYDASIALNPDNIMALNNYAYYLALGGGDLKKAEEMSLHTVEDQPDNPTYLDTYAWILYLQGRYADALQVQESALEKAVSQDNLSAEYWDHLGDIQYHCNLQDKAVESWKKALDLDPASKEIQLKVKRRKP